MTVPVAATVTVASVRVVLRTSAMMSVTEASGTAITVGAATDRARYAAAASSAARPVTNRTRSTRWSIRMCRDRAGGASNSPATIARRNVYGCMPSGSAATGSGIAAAAGRPLREKFRYAERI